MIMKTNYGGREKGKKNIATAAVQDCQQMITVQDA
jgi:hypothetical protein